MLEIVGMRFTAAEIIVVNENPVPTFEVGLNIDNVTKHDDRTVSIVFTYHLGYLPDVASVKVRGIAFCVDEPENIKRFVGEWEKKKEVLPELCANAINIINANTAVTALFLTRPFGLPPHLVPPPLIVPTGGENIPPKKIEEKKGKKRKKH